MDVWIVYAFIWTIVEGISRLRKNSFRRSMKFAAWWASIAAGLVYSGSRPPTEVFKFDGFAYIAFFGVISLAVFYSRVWAAKMIWKTSV